MQRSEKEIWEKLESIDKKLDELDINQRSVLTLEQVARYVNISSSYCYKLTSTNRIPFYRPNGKMLYFSKSEIDEWLLQNKSFSKNEIEKQADEYLSKNISKY